MSKEPVVKRDPDLIARSKSSSSEIASFLKAAKKTNPAAGGRIVFALDATMSRQPTWDRAMTIQSAMFNAVDQSSTENKVLSVQLLYFRGFGECRASKWVVNSSSLRKLMTTIDCRGGKTQIGKVLSHVEKETTKKKVDVLIFIGDAMEESVDELCDKAGRLGLKGTKCFVFQEGSDRATEQAFREIARLSRGAYFKLGPNSANELAELLAAIAVYAQGGLTALEASSEKKAQTLLKQLK